MNPIEPEKGLHIIDCCPELKLPRTHAKIAAFDLDWTLITPRKVPNKQLRKFPNHADQNDFVFFKNVPQKLKELDQNGYKIVIFTNQGSGSFDLEVFKKKMKLISDELKIHITVYLCTDFGYCKKPSVGMWEKFYSDFKNVVGTDIILAESFYVGDAAGRPKDFSDSDLKFAKNIGLRFFEPEQFFESKELIPIEKEYKLEHPLNTPKIEQVLVFPEVVQEMILLVGPPGCGKSTWAALYKEINENYEIISQDVLGSLAKVKKATEATIKAKKSVIVDRQNETSAKRIEFIDIAKKYNIPVRIVWFDLPKKLVMHLCTYREIMTEKHIPALVHNKYYAHPIEFGPIETANTIFKINTIILNPKVPINEKIMNSYLP